jgi:hypothetical protein
MNGLFVWGSKAGGKTLKTHILKKLKDDLIIVIVG